MLSRIAESLFWIGRYVERADNTARLLDVHFNVLLEDPWVDEPTANASLLAVMNCETTGKASRKDVLVQLASDPQLTSSIAGTLTAARENARRAREVISTEVWEGLNTTWQQLPGRGAGRDPHTFGMRFMTIEMKHHGMLSRLDVSKGTRRCTTSSPIDKDARSGWLRPYH